MGLIRNFKLLAGLSYVHVAIAFVAMGSWAIFANRVHPMPEPIFAGLVQGSLSGAITYIMKKALEGLLYGFAARGHRLLALVAPPLIVCSVSLAVLVGSHIVARTPEIFATISVPFSVAFTYACIYNSLIWKRQVMTNERA